MLLSGIIAALTSLLIPIIILLLLLPNACYVVEQQHAVIIERLGKFNRIVNAGFHMKVPVIDRKAATVSLRTMKNGFGIDVKTQDNVTIGLEVSAQYHVSYDMGAGPADSGIYKSYYMLQEPVDQMRDFITDALRSSIPVYTLDEVFAKTKFSKVSRERKSAFFSGSFHFSFLSLSHSDIDCGCSLSHIFSFLSPKNRGYRGDKSLSAICRRFCGFQRQHKTYARYPYGLALPV